MRSKKGYKYDNNQNNTHRKKMEGLKLDPRQQATVMRSARYHREQEKKELEKKKMIAQQGTGKLEAKRDRPFATAIAWSIMAIILGVLAALPSMGVSFMFALGLIPLFFIYAVFKRIRNNQKVKKQLYNCVYCGESFIGPKKACPNCGRALNCDTNRYQCTNCKTKFTGKRERCPKCNSHCIIHDFFFHLFFHYFFFGHFTFFLVFFKSSHHVFPLFDRQSTIFNYYLLNNV